MVAMPVTSTTAVTIVPPRAGDVGPQALRVRRRNSARPAAVAVVAVRVVRCMRTHRLAGAHSTVLLRTLRCSIL